MNMQIIERRDSDDARAYLLSSFWISRATHPNVDSLIRGLRWALELVATGAPLPPLGFVIDVGEVALGKLPAEQRQRDIMGVESSLTRMYEDYVLGKMYADSSFERASDAILRYQGRDQIRCIAYLLEQLRLRSEIGGAILSPAVVRSIFDLPEAELWSAAVKAQQEPDCGPQLRQWFQDLVQAIHTSGDLLGPEDVFELEHGTALAEFGQRVALRQVLQAATTLESGLLEQKPRPKSRKYSVATRILEEDTYPIGGFTSIANKGTVESLVRSELAYIDDNHRPDLFDIKFARGELLYYARDENQFQRRRLSYLFFLHPDLIAARFKDTGSSWQRIVLLLASLLIAVRKLTQWLSEDAIRFEFLFLQSNSEKLSDERTLLETIFREEMAAGIVHLESLDVDAWVERAEEYARRSLCHVVSISVNANSVQRQTPLQLPIFSQIFVDGAIPSLILEDDHIEGVQESGEQGWREALDHLLKFWV